MPTPIDQLLSRTLYDTDGVTTDWDFSFSGGYLDPSHVKAFTEAPSGARTTITVTEAMLTGPYTLRIAPALADDLVLTIYRDTPKNLPLVDFTDESGFSEISLDTNAKQAVFIAAEAVDVINTSSSYDARQAASVAANSAAAAAASAASVSGSVAAAAASAAAAAASAASIDPGQFASAEQGSKADSAVQPAGLTVAAITDASSLGHSFMQVVNAAAARTLAGLSAFGSSLATAADAAAARTLLALGALATKTTVGSADIDPGAVTPIKLSQPRTVMPLQTAISGTFKDFVVPTWVDEVVLTMRGVSTNGSNNYLVQLGSSGLQTYGYVGLSNYIASSSSVNQHSSSSGCMVTNLGAGEVTHAVITLTRQSGNVWFASFVGSSGGYGIFGSYDVALSGPIDQVRLLATDTFDLGSVGLMYK